MTVSIPGAPARATLFLPAWLRSRRAWPSGPRGRFGCCCSASSAGALRGRPGPRRGEKVVEKSGENVSGIVSLRNRISPTERLHAVPLVTARDAVQTRTPVVPSLPALLVTRARGPTVPAAGG